ncbi:MAG: hypothetical protein AVDCRST_MAG65-1801 [uncultured Solirubrobacteraceae bacterium]|uniref:NodB homology domain-containing protein n=1 Tax=uncultured Solirubrobacteraceae bacterium TaxID=1162706 RepID=A0A6J4S1M7_9ACTN|nr:MAG: hypothetical protein AVDCRST_MAG65-1801 [uncultured Solirubrobacteraceae bacterium]
MRSTFRRHPLAVLAAVLLAGCGGASGDDDAREARSVDGPPVGREAQLRAARAARADETGRVMVLEYHRIGGDPDFAPEWTISAREFRAELEYLRSHDYHPINLRDFVRNEIDAPAGKTPVVLTFDDSSDSQFTLIRRDGEWVPDPDGAVGVLADFHARHPDWPLRGTWFVLPKADPPNDFFGQPRLVRRKLEYLTGHGMEIGSHTLYHADLATVGPEEVRRQLALSIVEIRRHLPGYEVTMLGVPFGQYPSDVGLLRSGEWEGNAYAFEAAVEVAGGPSLPPGARGFDPMRIPRVQTGTGPEQSRSVFRAFERRPRARYRSDGNPDTIAFPKGHASRLDLEALHEDGKVFRGY